MHDEIQGSPPLPTLVKRSHPSELFYSRAWIQQIDRTGLPCPNVLSRRSLSAPLAFCRDVFSIFRTERRQVD